jgi:hypothetical protein
MLHLFSSTKIARFCVVPNVQSHRLNTDKSPDDVSSIISRSFPVLRVKAAKDDAIITAFVRQSRKKYQFFSVCGVHGGNIKIAG